MTVKVEAKARVFKLRGPVLAKGRADTPLAITDEMWVHLKVYAEGGENALHSHVKEDHVFIVLDGEATFHDQMGAATVLTKYEGILLPKGALYRFQSSGKTNLVMLRMGSGSNPYLPEHQNERHGPDGRPLVASSKENDPSGMGPPVPVRGKFFGVDT